MTKCVEMQEELSNTYIYSLLKKLYPIFRSITGKGVRDSLKIIQTHIPINIEEIPTGTKVYDWVIPKEWIIRGAYISDLDGNKIIDIKESNLFVLNYSLPIHNRKISNQELREHLYSLPDYPNWVPYRTSYYHETWGFCIPHRLLNKLNAPFYEVHIDADHIDGSLSYGELFIQGEMEEEILLTTYICHPSLCNDNLSGIAVLTYLAKWLYNAPRKYSYRILFIPETIGAIAWLATNQEKINNIIFGLVLTCLGDKGPFTFKKTKPGNTLLDKIIQKVLDDSGVPYSIVDFFPYGSDERQFSSPGINIPVGSLMRTMYGKYPEYHTSADNLEFIDTNSLNESYEQYCNLITVLEGNEKYVNLYPYCEPQLGKRGLLYQIGGRAHRDLSIDSLLWILNMSDGENSLLDIACRSNIKFSIIKEGADILNENNLIKIVN